MIVDPTDRDTAVGIWRFDLVAAGRVEGWEREYELFVTACRTPLLRYVRRITDRTWSDGEFDAEAIVQVTLTRAALGWAGIRRPRPWIYQVATWLVFQAARNRTRRWEITAILLGRPDRMLEDAEAELALAQALVNEQVLDALEPDRRRPRCWTCHGVGRVRHHGRSAPRRPDPVQQVALRDRVAFAGVDDAGEEVRVEPALSTAIKPESVFSTVIMLRRPSPAGADAGLVEAPVNGGAGYAEHVTIRCTVCLPPSQSCWTTAA